MELLYGEKGEMRKVGGVRDSLVNHVTGNLHDSHRIFPIRRYEYAPER